MFSSFIIVYLFLGGASSGVFLLVACCNIAFKPKNHSEEAVRHFETFRRNASVVAFVLFALAGIALFLDLGVPSQILLVFFRPHATVITFGSFAILLEAVSGGAFAAINSFNIRTNIYLARTIDIVCGASSLGVMAYTGVFLFASSVPFWKTPSIIGLFFFSSLSAGTAIVFLVEFFSSSRTNALRQTKRLQFIHLICLVLEAIFLALFLHHAFTTPEAAGALSLLGRPQTLATGIVGVMGFGIVIPFAFDVYNLIQKKLQTIPVSDIVCLTGGFLLRYCVVTCGVL